MMVNMKIQFLVLHMTVGLSYQQGCREHSTIKVGCVPEKCIGVPGKWIPDPDMINAECKKCNAHGDPHFLAFSGAKFDWHDPCNYALVQESTNMDPMFGVFMTLEEKDNVAYIGTPITYQENINTKVVIHDKDQSKLFTVEVGGTEHIVATGTPTLIGSTTVFGWKHQSTESYTSSECLRLYGKNYILVEVCLNSLTIWAPATDHSYIYTLGGLCGSTDSLSLAAQKLVARDGTPYPNPGNWPSPASHRFALSWKTKELNANCKTPTLTRKRSTRNQRSNELHKACGNDANFESGNHHNDCLGVHKGNGSTGDDHLAACKYDLCMAANGTEHKMAGYNESWALGSHKEIHSRTKMHKANTIDFVHGEICGIRNHDKFRSGPIGSNDESHYGEFPWMVALLTQDQDSSAYIGAGSLVHPRIVLTAAHNVVKANGLVARIGDLDLTDRTTNELIAAQNIKVTTVVIHPKFSPQLLENDVALLILESDAVFTETVLPICLPEPNQDFDKLDCTVTGWGDQQKVLRKAKVPSVDLNECQTMLRNTRLGQFFNLHNSFSCAGGDGGDFCGADGGSPLVCSKRNKPNEFVQMGVFAWSIGCGIMGNPGVYVSVPKYVDWIHHVMKEEGVTKKNVDIPRGFSNFTAGGSEILEVPKRIIPGRSGLHQPVGNTNSQRASFRKRLQPGGSTAQDLTGRHQPNGNTNSQRPRFPQRPQQGRNTGQEPNGRHRPIGNPNSQRPSIPQRPQQGRIAGRGHRGSCPNSNPCNGGFSNPRCARDLHCNSGYKCCRGCQVGLTCMPAV